MQYRSQQRLHHLDGIWETIETVWTDIWGEVKGDDSTAVATITAADLTAAATKAKKEQAAKDLTTGVYVASGVAALFLVAVVLTKKKKRK